MKDNLAIIIDTGPFYALFDRSDGRHLDSAALFMHIIRGKYGKPYTCDYVILEALLLIRKHLGTYYLKLFLNFIEKSKISIVVVDNYIFKESLKTMIKYIDKLSLTDAALLIIMNEFGIEYLASYDVRSFKGLVGNIIGINYYEKLSSEEKKIIEEKL
ncbi:MAG: hypothetical protein DRO23_06565 [Thermoprotei archaeon]|nr:MAG: hypothetical protein DRO23_06565 [Thermoprotei archaeon]